MTSTNVLENQIKFLICVESKASQNWDSTVFNNLKQAVGLHCVQCRQLRKNWGNQIESEQPFLFHSVCVCVLVPDLDHSMGIMGCI